MRFRPFGLVKVEEVVPAIPVVVLCMRFFVRREHPRCCVDHYIRGYGRLYHEHERRKCPQLPFARLLQCLVDPFVSFDGAFPSQHS